MMSPQSATGRTRSERQRRAIFFINEQMVSESHYLSELSVRPVIRVKQLNRLTSFTGSLLLLTNRWEQRLLIKFSGYSACSFLKTTRGKKTKTKQ